jgi:hypothetical protein
LSSLSPIAVPLLLRTNCFPALSWVNGKNYIGNLDNFI